MWWGKPVPCKMNTLDCCYLSAELVRLANKSPNKSLGTAEVCLFYASPIAETKYCIAIKSWLKDNPRTRYTILYSSGCEVPQSDQTNAEHQPQGHDRSLTLRHTPWRLRNEQ